MDIEDKMGDVSLPENAEDKERKVPQVSIGMPVYNSEPFIREALDSLLAQTFTDFELIISDNASTDGTEAICREYAAKDFRIRYVRQAENRGATANFQFVLDEAVGEYFMWAAADDVWGKDFVQSNLSFLRSNDFYIGSMVKSITLPVTDEEDESRAGCREISGSTGYERALSFIKRPGANSRFYGLFRREFLNKLDLRAYNYLGGDWGIIMDLLEYGSIGLCSNQVSFFKRSGMSANIVKLADSTRTTFLEFLIPYWFLTKKSVALYGLRRISMLWVLIGLNFAFFRSYWKQVISGYLRSVK